MARGNKVTVTTYCYVYKAAYDVIITTFALIVIFQAAEDLQKSVRATVVPPAKFTDIHLDIFFSITNAATPFLVLLVTRTRRLRRTGSACWWRAGTAKRSGNTSNSADRPSSPLYRPTHCTDTLQVGAHPDHRHGRYSYHHDSHHGEKRLCPARQERTLGHAQRPPKLGAPAVRPTQPAVSRPPRCQRGSSLPGTVWSVCVASSANES